MDSGRLREMFIVLGLEFVCFFAVLYSLWWERKKIGLIALCTMFVFSIYRYVRQKEIISKLKQERTVVRESLIRSQKLATIGTLASGIAHEINNPLAIIDQEAQLMEGVLERVSQKIDPEVQNELRESLTAIRDYVRRCAHVTHRLLQMARRDKPILQCIDMNELVEDVVKTVERLVSNKKISFVRNYDLNLSSVKTDPPLVRQILINLINNAVHAVGFGGEIVISTGQTHNGRVFFSVSDNGPGISEELQEKIFEPFFTTKKEEEGTGIGLALCQVLVERLGGAIELKSMPGKGTTFTVWLGKGEDDS